MFQDLRFGLRTLRKNPGFTLIAIMTLALGIGVNTAIFSVVNALLFRSLPYTDPERLVMIWETNPLLAAIGFTEISVTGGAFDDWRKQANSLESVSILDARRLALTGVDKPERIAGVSTSSNFFKVMGATPILGRVYGEDEDQPGANHVVVISDALWQRRFGGDREVCGKTMKLDGDTYTIIGVMPQGFQFPRAADLPSFFQLPPQAELWTPAQLTSEQLQNRGSHGRAVIARLNPGVTLAQAQAEIDTITNRSAQQFPDSQGWGARVMPLKEQLVGKLRRVLLILLGAVGFVLLIACVNVANLLLTRAATRQREIAICVALGAGRWRIMRRLLTESVLLALAGGLVGLMLAILGVDLLIALSPESIPRKHEIAVDGMALLFTFSVSLITGVFFGLAPAFQTSRIKLGEMLKDSTRGSTTGRSRLRGLLITTEVALSLMLLIGAGLLIRSFSRLMEVGPGFDPQNVAALTLTISSNRYDFDPKQVKFFKQVIDNMKSIPGVVSVGAVSELPQGGGEEMDVFAFEGQTRPKNLSEEPTADFRFIDEGYFKTLGVDLLSGRTFSENEDNSKPRVTIVNETLSRRFFGVASPIGRRVKAGSFDSDEPWATIVGVVKDVKHSGLDVEPRAQLYFPYQQISWGRLAIVVRSRVDVASLFGPMREAVWAVNKDQPITELRTMEDYLGASVSQPRFNAILLGAFAFLAVSLAAVGIYGVVSYVVTQRTQEIGIRIALGARTTDVLRLVMQNEMKLVLFGLALGVVGAFALTRFMTTLLFGVTATDALTFTAVTIGLMLVALFACWLPARRATKVDPLVALRYE
jgi:putative ABC transport system permease protein